MTRPEPKFGVGEWVVQMPEGATTRVESVEFVDRLCSSCKRHGTNRYALADLPRYDVGYCECAIRPLPPPERAEDEFTADLTRWLGQSQKAGQGVS